MKWPLNLAPAANVLAIPCLRAEMLHYGMQACDHQKKL